MIVSDQIGNGILGKVYLIQKTQPPHTKLIAKIFDERSEEQYNNEKNILIILSNLPNNSYTLKIKNIDIELDFINYFPYNSRYILFDYLQYGNLSKYLSQFKILNDIPEKFTKLMCYKLLKGFQIMHSNNICHNKIDINNIMFDDDFNPIIIHFSEAFISTDNNFKNDFRGLGKIIAIMMTSGRFKCLKPNKVKKCYEIIDNAKRRNIETDFWNNFKNIDKEFILFFDKLLKSKTSLNIDELLNDVWLKQIKDIYDNKNALSKIENDFKNDFIDRYQKILFIEEQDKKIFDIHSIIDIENRSKFNNSLVINSIEDTGNRSGISNDKRNIFNLEIRKINSKPKGFQFDYIEIDINDKNDYNYNYDNPKFFYLFIYYLQAFIENMDNLKNTIEYSEQYLSFNATFEENKINGNEEINECNEDNDNEFDDIMLEEDEIENLEMKIELLKYKKNNKEINNIYNDEICQEKYYLMFNYIQGDICDYYHYLNIIKEKAKIILNEKINK